MPVEFLLRCSLTRYVLYVICLSKRKSSCPKTKRTSVRSIENTGRENLIVIRVADEGHGYDAEGFDKVVSQSAGVVLSGLVTDGLKTFNGFFHEQSSKKAKTCSSPRKSKTLDSPCSVVASGHEI
jgi:hypothetical protein